VKVETRSAVDNFDAIAAEADGVMVARGDLGVDLPFEDVPLVQKDLIRRATTGGKFVIVATQMLESMTGAPRPTRAEVSDVANAVLDGADAVMLSAESAIGQFPVETLEAMERICAKAEADGVSFLTPAGYVGGESTGDAIIAAATYISMRDTAGPGIPDAIWCFTRTGRTAELLSLSRPGMPIVAFTLSPIVARRLAVRRAVMPVVLSANAKTGTLIERMEGAWRSQRGAEPLKTVLLVTTSQRPGGINRLEIHELGGAAAI
jgi:pyruvate kinase